jgi:hypothetical protein
MQSLHRALSPFMLAAADLGVGGLLYQEVSATLGGVLLAAGLLVLATVAYESLTHGGSVLRRRVSAETAE